MRLHPMLTLSEGQRDGTRLHLAKFERSVFPTINGKLAVVVSEYWRGAETRLVLTEADALLLRDWLSEHYPPEQTTEELTEELRRRGVIVISEEERRVWEFANKGSRFR